MTRPSAFVGSSTEGLEFARAARGLLTEDAEVTLWNEDFSGLGNTFIETLTEAAPRFDFAILVLTPDDLLTSRQEQTFSPRDNVIFELGLFMGRLGRARTFILHQEREVKLPSDLAGVTNATFEWPREDGSHTAAVGAACDRIRRVIRELGISEAKVERELRGIAARQDDHGRALSRQQDDIRFLQVALRGIVTKYELDKLTGLDGERPFLCRYTPDLGDELKRLRAMSLIGNHEGVGLRTIIEHHRDSEFDLHDFFFITQQGREYLALRSELDEVSPSQEPAP